MNVSTFSIEALQPSQRGPPRCGLIAVKLEDLKFSIAGFRNPLVSCILATQSAISAWRLCLRLRHNVLRSGRPLQDWFQGFALCPALFIARCQERQHTRMICIGQVALGFWGVSKRRLKPRLVSTGVLRGAFPWRIFQFGRRTHPEQRLFPGTGVLRGAFPWRTLREQRLFGSHVGIAERILAGDRIPQFSQDLMRQRVLHTVHHGAGVELQLTWPITEWFNV